jgi:hypothetical protein
MEIATTYEERIALIKKIAERRARWKNGARIAKRWTDEVERERKSTRTNLTAKYDSGESMIHFTDNSKYLNEHYGDRVRSTRAYEEDWG